MNIYCSKNKSIPSRDLLDLLEQSQKAMHWALQEASQTGSGVASSNAALTLYGIVEHFRYWFPDFAPVLSDVLDTYNQVIQTEMETRHGTL